MTDPFKEKAVLALLSFQLFLVLTLIVLQPGFDHPNSLGLDFGFVLILLALAGICWLVGLILSCTLSERRGMYVFSYLASPFVCFLLLLLGDV